MKTFKTTLNTIKYFALALCISLSVSCDVEDGADGMDGQEGIAGQNGEDGNANVSTYTFDVSNRSGAAFDITFPELTSDVLENDVILSYITTGTIYYPIPGIYNTYLMEVELFVNTLNIYFYNRQGGTTTSVNAGLYTEVKAIIIESTSNTGRSMTKTNVEEELRNAGVDINDYYAVCDFYGIDY